MNIDQEIEKSLREPLDIQLDPQLAIKLQRKIAIQELMQKRGIGRTQILINVSMVLISVILLIIFLGKESINSLAPYVLWVAIPGVLILIFNRLEKQFMKAKPSL